MDLTESPADTAFRRELVAWLDENLTQEWTDTDDGEDDWFPRSLAWDRLMDAAGWQAISWPSRYGGRDATPAQQAIYDEELARRGAPRQSNQQGIRQFAAALMVHGTPEQKAAHLEKIRTSEEVWCQGFSEPDAGSDLANVRLRADLVDDEFVLNGSKTWTSNAHHAQWIFNLCRTDSTVPKHAGMTMILVPMDAPGIEVRPLIDMTDSHHFNEVFFTDVRVPRSNALGGIGEGWAVAQTVLASERGIAPTLRYATYKRELDDLMKVAQELRRRGKPVLEDDAVRQRFGDIIVRLELLRTHALDIASRVSRSQPLGVSPSMTKLHWSETHQDLGELAMEVGGESWQVGSADDAHLRWRQVFLSSRAETIYAGTSQIQKNIIAERGLGMPR